LWSVGATQGRHGLRHCTLSELAPLDGPALAVGGARLRVIGSPVYLRGSVGGGLFAGASLIVITLMDSSGGGRLHQTSERSLVAARALLATATLVMFVLPRTLSSRTLGTSDLLVALGVLLSAVLDERRTSCRPLMLEHPPNLSVSPEQRRHL
jgi:hypothetical protein